MGPAPPGSPPGRRRQLSRRYRPKQKRAEEAGGGEKKEDWYEEAMANAERELAEDAEWKRIQENTFTRWVNEHLRQAGTSINDL